MLTRLYIDEMTRRDTPCHGRPHVGHRQKSRIKSVVGELVVAALTLEPHHSFLHYLHRSFHPSSPLFITSFFLQFLNFRFKLSFRI